MIHIQWFNSLTDFYKFFPFILFYSTICILYFFNILFYNTINEKNNNSIDYDQNITKRNYSEYWDLLIILYSYQIHHFEHVIYLESFKHVLFQRITKNTHFSSESSSRIAIIVFLENELTFFSSNRSCLFFFWLSNTLWYFKSARFTFRSVMHTALKVLIPVLLVFAVVSTVRTVSAQENTKSFMAGGIQSDEVSESVANVWISPRILIFEHLLFQSFLARCFP